MLAVPALTPLRFAHRPLTLPRPPLLHAAFLFTMGIDIRAGGRYIGHKNRTEAKSENVYLRLIVKVRSAAGAARVEWGSNRGLE